jgi:hypothetical protein
LKVIRESIVSNPGHYAASFCHKLWVLSAAIPYLMIRLLRSAGSACKKCARVSFGYNNDNSEGLAMTTRVEGDFSNTSSATTVLVMTPLNDEDPENHRQAFFASQGLRGL